MSAKTIPMKMLATFWTRIIHFSRNRSNLLTVVDPRHRGSALARGRAVAPAKLHLDRLGIKGAGVL